MRKKLERIRESEQLAVNVALNSAIKQLNNDAESFIHHLLTERERVTIGRRVLIANLILSGYTQIEICNQLNVSPNTYTKIKRWLEDELSNYEQTNIVERERGKKKTTRRLPKPFTFDALKRNYPTHFLLFTLSNNLLRRLKG